MKAFEKLVAEARAAEEKARQAFIRSGQRVGGNGPAQPLAYAHELAKKKLDELIATAPIAWFVKEARTELAKAEAYAEDLEVRCKGVVNVHLRAARRKVRDAQVKLAELLERDDD